MDEATKMLELLSSELPDCDQQLSSQDIGLIPRTFALFPKLPKELRLDIWDISLPGKLQFVVLVAGPSPEDEPEDLRPEDDPLYDFNTAKKATGSSVRAILHVNRESRTEVFKHLKGFFKQVGPPYFARYNSNVGLFCFDRELHTLLIPERSWYHSCNLGGAEWLDRQLVPAVQPVLDLPTGCSATVRVLELECRFWLPSCSDKIFGSLDKSAADAEDGLLQGFPNLERLHLIMTKSVCSEMDPPEIFIHYEYCDRDIKRSFRVLKEANPDYQVPEVFYHGWRRRQSRSDFQQQNDARIFPPGRRDRE